MAASFGRVVAQLQRWTSPHLEELSDAVLLERFLQQRDESAFAALVTQHGGMVLRSCRRVLGDAHDAEDAFQATFLILVRKAHTLRQPETLPGFLHSIARRVALKARRGARRSARRGQPSLPPLLPDPHPDPLTQLSARELLDILEEEVGRLPAAQRSAVVLCCLEGNTREEAANALGCSVGSLKGHLERGRKRLQAQLTHRGITLSAALAIATVSRGEAVSASLLRSTVTTALGGGIGSSAAALADSVLKTMFLSKLAGVMTVVLTLALAASSTLAWSYRGSEAKAPEDKEPAVPVAPKNVDASKPTVRTDVWGDPLPPHAVARLGSLRLYHHAAEGRQVVHQVVLSPDGKRVASMASTEDGGNKLWDVQTGRELPLAEPLRCAFLFTAKGKLLGAGQGNQLWDVATGKEVPCEGIDVAAARKRKDPHQHETLSPDGNILAAWGDDKGVRLLDARSRKELPALESQQDLRIFHPPCFSPDGKLLAVSGFNGPVPGVRLWDLATRKEACWLRGKESPIDLAFSGDGKIIAAVDGEGVTLWDTATGKWLHDWGHTSGIGTLAFTPDGKTLLTGAVYNDPFLRAWDPFTGRPRGKWEGHKMGINQILVTPDGKQVISPSQYDTIRLRDLASGKETGRIGEKNLAWSAALSPDGKLLAIGGQGIQVWDLATRRKVRSFGGGCVGQLAFSPDGTKLASSYSEVAIVRLWNVANGEELRSFKGETGGGTKFGFSPDGHLLATGDEDGVIHLWAVATGQQLRQLGQPLETRPEAGGVSVLGALTFSPDSRVVAAGYFDRMVRLLEVSTGKERARYQGHRAEIDSLAYSPDGRLLASGGGDRTILVWDVTGRVRPDKPDLNLLATKEQDRLWGDLADSDAAKAYQAMRVLSECEQAVNLLKKRLRPAAATDAARLNRLVTELDSEEFAVREKATRELAALGDRAESVLRKAFPKASAEARRRIKDILVKMEPASSADSLRGLRAVEVLEWLGSVEAQQVLKTLAGGDPQARLTREAKAALERLAKQGEPENH